MPTAKSTLRPTQSPAPTTPSLYFARCELRQDTRQLLVDDSERPLRRRVFDIMLYLIAQRPRAVPHAELLRKFWAGRVASPKVLARAVMEARRACEEAPEDPKLFVSVHGVGYRFAGVLADRVVAAQDPAPAHAASVDEVRDLLAQATAAMHAARFGQAQALAQRALVQASQAQSQAERVHALVLCSAVALRVGTAEPAAKLAAQALQIARGEGQPQLVARARMAAAWVHVFEGDPALGIETLEECRKVFAASGDEADLLTCLVRLTHAFRRHGNPQAGLVLCRNAMELARKLNAPYEIFALRSNEVGLLGHWAEVQVNVGHEAAAPGLREEALALSRKLLEDLPADEYADLHQLVLLHNSYLLRALGRLAEALGMQGAIELTFESMGANLGPLLKRRKSGWLLSRADLLSRLGRHEEAIKQLEEMEPPEFTTPAHLSQGLYYETSRLVYHRAGRLAEALEWAEKEVKALHEMYPSQATRLTTILEAELNTGELQAELARAREHNAALRHEVDALRARVAALQGTVPVSPDTGLAAPQLLGSVFGAPLAHAQARGLPMCVGLLELASRAAEASERTPQTTDALLKRAAEVLRQHPDIAHPAVNLGDGRVAFRIREAGPTRAAEVCAAVLAELQRQEWFLLGLGVAPSWACNAADAAAAGTIEASVEQLVALGHARRAASARVLPPPESRAQAKPARAAPTPAPAPAPNKQQTPLNGHV